VHYISRIQLTQEISDPQIAADTKCSPTGAERALSYSNGFLTSIADASLLVSTKATSAA